MKLEQLLKGIHSEGIEDCFKSLDIQSLSCDSRTVEAGSFFVALKGQTSNGEDFIADAINNGASIVATENKEFKRDSYDNVCFLIVDDIAKFLRDIVERFYVSKHSDVNVVGITGTNGKTTITYLIESVLKAAGLSCGVVGTINARAGGDAFYFGNTTPSFIDNHKFLSELQSRKIKYCVMEASSHGLDQGRVDLINFKQAIFTNLTGDHLDYHNSMENYFLAKSKLFTSLPENSTAIINIDDSYAGKLIEIVQSKTLTYGIENDADIKAENIELNMSHTKFKLIAHGIETEIETNLIGNHNVYNVLAAISFGLSEGININDIKTGIENLKVIPGRLEVINCRQEYSVIIDYAHTRDALLNILKAIKEISESKVILVFGCGGDRDKTKRSQMAEVACRLADFSIVTSDNSRSEDSESIIDDIIVGFKKDNYEVIVDRKEAIHKALEKADKDSIVVLAGKGHETYQILKDGKKDFDERKIVGEYFDVNSS
ncbi:MAG: UDP-N-acetylmuramoyl-L-alanyl-D-glutamate--2,6-diaminopimelate ligase [Candidatus Zapsychrus exili]|nr:UDP-N-acetylmuramoyl-L-alanyl-D-glutamate--2,6-diaminopimelate ligase [Candidatus Zapsychrus exili]